MRNANETGYPVMIKAVAGGGGKGMRRVNKAIEFDAALEAAKREAQSSFGNDKMLIEKFISSPRHIEIQVFADDHGNVVHLFERDCSLQRRHQKVIEEAPAPGMTDDLRHEMGKAACNAAQAVGYRGAGTVEFIVDGQGGLSQDGFFFMEMNTRLQVEHPVTEAITGTDLVEWQLRVASGEELPLDQDEIRMDGHAVEARIYAEDPESGFLPATGQLVRVEFPGNVRADTGIETGDEISPFYDPMIAKLIARGDSRDMALDNLRDALAKTIVAGPKTNITFLTELCDNEQFRSGKFDTGLIDSNLEDLTSPGEHDSQLEAAGIVSLIAQQQAQVVENGEANSPWSVNDAFSNGLHRTQNFRFVMDDDECSAEIGFDADGVHVLDSDGVKIDLPSDCVAVNAGKQIYILKNGRQLKIEPYIANDAAGRSGDSDGVVRVPMHGKIVSVSIADGDEVEEGDLLFAVEAMKMEHAVIAPLAGIVSDCAVVVGEQMEDGAVGLKIEVPVSTE